MKAIKLIYGSSLAVKKAFQAGNDIIVFRLSHSEEKRIINFIINLTRKGSIKEKQINRSVRRIIKMKEKYNIFDNNIPSGINVEKVNEEISRIRDIIIKS